MKIAKKAFIGILLLIILTLGGCGSQKQKNQNEEKIPVTIKFEVIDATLIDFPCDLLIDGEKVCVKVKPGEEEEVEINLSEGMHKVYARTSNWGLTTGKESNKLEVDINASTEEMTFNVRVETMGDLVLW